MIYFGRREQKYYEFSNFYKAPFLYKGNRFIDIEAAFQSEKCKTDEEKKLFIPLSGSKAKSKGRSVVLKPDWENVKFDVMLEAVREKFTQHPELGEILKSTGKEALVENTTGWHDNVWGMCSCPKCIRKLHKNFLGVCLMKVRAELTGDNEVHLDFINDDMYISVDVLVDICKEGLADLQNALSISYISSFK